MPCVTPHVKEKPNRETVLFVDDELRLLDGLRRLLKVEGFDILCAPSGEVALDLLRTHPVRVVVSDHRMPGMSGLEFLKQVYEEYPETVRMMLTGHADRDMARRAVQDGTVFRFFSKPCKTFDLAVTIRQALTMQAATPSPPPDPLGVHTEWGPMLDVLQEGVLVIDAERTILLANKGAENIWQWGKEELQGQSLDMLLAWESFNLDEEPPGCCLKFERFDLAQRRLTVGGQRKDGTTIPLELFICQDQHARFVIVATVLGEEALRDNPVFHNRSQNVGEATIQLGALEPAFSSIEGPVNVLMGFSQLLEARGKMEPALMETLRQVREAGGGLVKAIRHIRDGLIHPFGAMALNKASVPMGPIMSETLSVVTPLAWEYDVSLIDQTLSHCHVNLRCDPIVLRWILVNLLTETVKGSHHGGTIWIRSELINVGTFRMSILDTRRHMPTSFSRLDLLGGEEAERIPIDPSKRSGCRSFNGM